MTAFMGATAEVKFTAKRSRSLFHALYPKAVCRRDMQWINPDPIVADRQDRPLPTPFQGDFSGRSPRVAGDIRQGFTDNQQD
jgi:hypothetical protein